MRPVLMQPFADREKGENRAALVSQSVGRQHNLQALKYWKREFA